VNTSFGFHIHRLAHRYGPHEWQAGAEQALCHPVPRRKPPRVANMRVCARASKMPLGISTDFIFQNHRMPLDVDAASIACALRKLFSLDTARGKAGHRRLGPEMESSFPWLRMRQPLCRQFDFHFFPAGASKCQRFVFWSKVEAPGSEEKTLTANRRKESRGQCFGLKKKPVRQGCRWVNCLLDNVRGLQRTLPPHRHAKTAVESSRLSCTKRLPSGCTFVVPGSSRGENGSVTVSRGRVIDF